MSSVNNTLDCVYKYLTLFVGTLVVVVGKLIRYKYIFIIISL